MLATTLPRRLGCGVMLMRVMLVIMLLSHAGDDAIEVTWPRRDVDVESCWGQ
jgi:hypothetical protein